MGYDLPPFLNRAVMLHVIQSCGTSCSSNDRENINLRNGDISSAASLSILQEMLSGPDALL
jgi:hypothetical protein